MLVLKRVEVVNFACFEHLDLDLAATHKTPLTVIRAENGSGKTTFLRALRWGFYGDRGLPGDDPGRFSVHPAWWKPDDGTVETRVSVTFQTDGGGRYDEQGGPNKIFKLTRSVETIAREVNQDDEPDFRRIEPSLSLLQRVENGGWEPYSDAPDVIERAVDLLLPWGLRDFFFLDADEATDYVGGRENNPLPKKEVIEKTTASINELLGLGTFQDAIERVKNLKKDFQRQASRATGDTSIQEMQEELDAIRERIEDIESKLQTEKDELADLQDMHERTYGDLQEALKETGAHEQLDKRQEENRQALQKAEDARKRTLEQLSSQLEGPGVLSGLAIGKVNTVFKLLEPLHERGLIPLSHVSFVRDRLEQEECICKESLAEGTSHRANVEQLLAESSAQEEQSNLLGRLHEVCGGVTRDFKATNHTWANEVDDLRVELGEIDTWIADLEQTKDELGEKIDRIDRDHVQTLKGELDALDGHIERLRAGIAERNVKLTPLRDKETSLDKQISQRHKRERSARDKQAAAELADAIERALSNAYNRIQQGQVVELSRRMDALFGQMAANVPDADFGHDEEEKATVRMIAEVGVREVSGSEGEFEIFAKNHRDRILPPVEINGASRRVLALSFILALCEESNTEAPLVADSLLNMMSGKVRTNTFRTAVNASRQTVLLLTRADLAEPAELELVDEYAGETITLTGQWDAVGATASGSGGDVVNLIAARQVAIACGCGPREYCDVCERVGDSAKPNWNKVPTEIQGEIR